MCLCGEWRKCRYWNVSLMGHLDALYKHLWHDKSRSAFEVCAEDDKITTVMGN